MRFKNYKSGLGSAFGFTLIEIMIVVFIIALLSTAAVGGYTRYRKISLLELAVDNIVSTIYQARDSARSGAGGGAVGVDPMSPSSSAVCYGILFDKNSGIPVRKVSTNFNSMKKWKSGKWVDGSCDTADVTAGSGEPIDLDDLVVIEMEKPSCWILFSPPSGEISTSCGDVDENLSILINYGEEADASYQRTIKFNLKSGIANVEGP